MAPRALCLCLGGGLLLASWLAGGAESPLGYLVPIALVFAPLLAGRYFGERAIARLRSAAQARPRHRRAFPSPLPRPGFRRLPRGSALLSSSIGGLPPPPRTG